MSPTERQQILDLTDRLAAAEARAARSEKVAAALVRKGVLADAEIDREEAADARDR